MQEILTDIAVIGGGTAGLAAALIALEKGTKNVVVLEKKINYGGNSSMAGGFLFAAESRLQKETGNITFKDVIYKETLEYHHFARINPRLIWALIDRSGETIDWLENQGLQFTLGRNNSHVLKGKFNVAIMQYSLVMDVLAEKIKYMGGKILLRTAGRKILRGTDGAISGILASTRNGEDINIRGKVVILSTGGFTGNKELLKKYFDYDDFSTEALPLKGDGIKMAEEAGAYLEDYATICQHGSHARYIGLDTIKNRPNHQPVTGPTTIWVNTRGERFVDEGNPPRFAHLLFRQPGKVAFSIFDDKLLQTVPQEGIMGGAPDPGAVDMVALRKEVRETAGAKNPDIYMSDTVEGIASYIGADPAVLRATLDEYNSFCDHGKDESLNKNTGFLKPLRTPPYYAGRIQAGIVEAIGPVRINERTEVLDKQGKPIPGFYAAGAITSGWCGHDYHIFGSNLGFGTTAGRIAGENAAKYIAKN